MENAAPQTLYSEMILDLYRNPLNKKKLADFDAEHHEHNSLCGDDIIVGIKFGEDKKVVDVGFEGEGCAISQAAASLFTEEIKGKTVEEILNFTDDVVLKLLRIEISYSRQKCALLCFRAVKECLKK